MSELTEEMIRRDRRRTRLWSVLSTLFTAQLFFWCFAFGANLGPAPLAPIELIVGALLSASLGVLMAWPIIRRRVELSATWITQLKEGKKKRRVAFFDQYLTIDKDIVLKQRVESAGIDSERLTLVYDVYGEREPRRRVLEGPLPMLERARGLISAES